MVLVYHWNMVDLPLTALRALAAVHDTGGIRAAAAKLGIAHSSVSRHVSELEAYLGVAITTEEAPRRGTVLTPQGVALGQAALVSLRQLASAVSAVREGRSRRSVTISTMASLAERWLLPNLMRFNAAHPDIEVSILVDSRLASFQGNDVDLAIRFGKGRWPGVECEPLMDDCLVPVMSPEYWHNAGRPSHVEALTSMRLLHDRDPNTSWEKWRSVHGPATLDVSAGPRFTSSELLIRAAILGHGVALTHQRLAADDIAQGRLVCPFGELAVGLGHTYWLVLPPALRRRAEVETVIGWLKSMRSHPFKR